MSEQKSTEPHAPLRLIVNADDFGITDPASAKIVECHVAGSVTSTTLMANMPGAGFAARLALENPALGVGLHFNLTTGRPLSPAADVPSLVGKDGNFFKRAGLLARVAAGLVRARDVERELQAQIDRMHQLGLAPTHFDSHQHVHAVPLVFSIVAGVAHQRGVPVRLPHAWPGRVVGKSWSRRGSEFALDLLVRRCQRRLPAGIRVNDGFCSIFDLNKGHAGLSSKDYQTLVDAYAGGVVELMVHPAAVDDELRLATEIADVSAVEAGILSGSFLHDVVAARGGRLATYRDAFA